MNIEKLSTDDLLSMYAYAIARDHYDPMGSKPPKFDAYDLRQEIMRRIGDNED